MATWLERDPDARVIRWGWTLWIAWGLVGGALLLNDAGNGTGVLSFILVAPFWGLWLLWPTYRSVRAVWAWQSQSAWGEWNGAYYEFDGRQIRILFEGERVWVAADDVFNALNLQGRQRYAGRVRQIAGRDGLVRLPHSRLLMFSEIGIKAWLDRRIDKDAHKFARWLDKQVIEPYRRRLQMAVEEPDNPPRK